MGSPLETAPTTPTCADASPVVGGEEAAVVTPSAVTGAFPVVATAPGGKVDGLEAVLPERKRVQLKAKDTPQPYLFTTYLFSYLGVVVVPSP